MLYTNLYREILKVYNEDTKSYHESIGTSITNTVNSASQTISDTRKANAMQDSQFKNVSELLTSKETFMAQCNDIFKTNNNYDALAREIAGYIPYDSTRDFISAIAGGINIEEVSTQFDKISNNYLNNPQLLGKILQMVTDDIVKMPAANKNKWTMAAQHLKDSLTKAIDTTGPKQPQQQPQASPQNPQESSAQSGSGTVLDAAEVD